GGNINPACTPDKGNLNHVAHSAKLHFQGRDIVVTRCGNIPGFDGSESPVTPFSFIEFEGPGTLSALGGCNDSICDDLPLDCSFTGRIEDRNEPGSKEAIDPQGGALIDRYHIHVSCPGYPDALVFAGISPDPA
ncbi:MAG: hypothetical protein GTN76_09870, partial [Candidatus Aenigmarchaeota archaeon]|nr:hypothetical protein [Candidatus Aenigmarchaeota archaeon]